MSKQENKKVGNYGEEIACKYLEKLDYQIIERNFTSYRGEIDIIAMDKDRIVFVEVKTRTQSFCGAPCESVNWNKKKQLYKVAEYYLFAHNQLFAKVRFDVIEIFLYGSDAYRIHHIKDAIIDSPFNKHE